MKRRTAGRILFSTMLLALGIGMGITNVATPARASGGSGATAETIKVGKCEYAVTGSYVELLISAGSSNSSAHLYAYLPDGTYLGEVQNGGGGRYGGTVFVVLYIPDTITIRSSTGGSITTATTPYQP